MGTAQLQGWSANAAALVVAFVVTYGAAALGGAGSASSVSFYDALHRPAWAPSPAVFGPVWTALYTLMAVSAFVVARDVGWRAALVPLAAYLAQLLLNAGWTWLFFAWHRGAGAFAEMIVLALVIVLNIVLFWRIRPIAGALLLPYLAWVCFATLLTWSVWRANPGLL